MEKFTAVFFCFSVCYNGTNREDGEPDDPTDSQSHHGEQNCGCITAFVCDAAYRRVLCALSLVRGFGHGGRDDRAQDTQREQVRGAAGQCGGCAVSGGLCDPAGTGNPVSGLDVGLDFPDCGGKSGSSSVVCRARKTTAVPHTILNKITGFLIFLIPLVMRTVPVIVPASIAAASATAAAIQDAVVLGTRHKEG